MEVLSGQEQKQGQEQGQKQGRATPLLSIRNLTKELGGARVLDDVSFEVHKGEFLSILGPSGCGKTTLLRILIGLIPATSGTVEKDGAEISALPPSRRGMGIVFQNYALFENMTVLGNVAYALTCDRATRPTARATALTMLERTGLSAYADRYPAHLSGGQQQRVAIARTLAKNPDILLFDEPMSALDVAMRLQLREELKQIQRTFGTTMLYVTHDQEEAFALSDRIMVMGEARIHQIGTPRELVAHPADAYVETFVLDNLRRKIDGLRACMEAQA